MSRSYRLRCAERLERLRRRAEFLRVRISQSPERELIHDTQERSALLWAIEEIERWNTVVEALESDLSDVGKLVAISALVRSRLRPSADDIRRTKQLAKQYGWALDEPAAEAS